MNEKAENHQGQKLANRFSLAIPGLLRAKRWNWVDDEHRSSNAQRKVLTPSPGHDAARTIVTEIGQHRLTDLTRYRPLCV